MKTALCTTTIHVPHVLKLYREHDPSVRFFVATDEKTPTLDFDQLGTVDNVLCFRGDCWKCSRAIGFNTLARRNIAFLEALKWGADLIISIDDDNFPISANYFACYKNKALFPNFTFNGLVASSASGWFDAGQLLLPPAKHRGIPHGDHPHEYAPITGARIGVMTGLVLGNSDVDSVTRLERHVDSRAVSQLALAGVVVEPATRTVFNTQNTAVIRELVPAWFMMPRVGRYDDLWASLIVRRVMRERELYLHVGQPFVYQQRHDHDLIADLCDELGGMKHIKLMAALLDSIILKGKSVIGDTRTIYESLRHAAWIPQESVDAAFAYLSDCEEIGL